MTNIQRLIQAAEARAAAASRGAKAAIDALALAAFEKMWRRLVAIPEADAAQIIREAQAEFGGAFSEALAAAFSDLLQRSIGVDEVRALPVGQITLSRHLYLHSSTTAAEVLHLVREHAKGLLQARDLSLALYDGYSPADGIQRPLEGRARAELPMALRSLTEDMDARRELTALQVQGQKQAARLKSQALRAAYSEAFDAWEKGAGAEALQRRLDVAQREKNRFFANRIAQSELARAHNARVAMDLMDDDLTTVVQVRLNPAHPRPDICDLHATADLWGLGPGCYPKERAPMPTYHPFCWCRVRPRPSLDARDAVRAPNGEAEFLRALGDDKAAEVMGSRERAARVLSGEQARDVVDEGVPMQYRLKTLRQAAEQGHALVREPEPV